MKKSIIINGITFIGEYSPEEKMVMYYKDGSGYPGCSAEFELEDARGTAHDLIELIDALLAKKKINIYEELESLCLENMEEENGN